MAGHETNGPLTITGVASSEAGARSNAYLLDDGRDLVLFDVPMLQSDARVLAEAIDRTGRRLTTVFIWHAHPDHFLASDLIADRFPAARFVSAPNVVADIEADGPRMLRMLQGRLGPERL
jgi:glyoxylase-like metal-dependent hydrolase (beta-lactamase superfamily II)